MGFTRVEGASGIVDDLVDTFVDVTAAAAVALYDCFDVECTTLKFDKAGQVAVDLSVNDGFTF